MSNVKIIFIGFTGKMKEQQRQIIENYVASYNSFDINGMIRDLDDKLVFENVSNGRRDLRTEGINEFRQQAESAKQYFTQRKQTIESWEFNDSIVVIYIDYQGVLNIELPNGMKKGDRLNLKGKSTFEFEKGKIIKITDES